MRDPFAFTDHAGEPVEIFGRQLLFRDDVIDDCTRHIVDLFPSGPQPSEQVLLLAAHRRVAGTSQFRIEHPVTFDGRGADTHIPAAGIGVFRKGNDLFPVIECSGDRRSA